MPLDHLRALEADGTASSDAAAADAVRRALEEMLT